MTLSTFERSLDKIAPAFLMILGLVAAIGSAGLGFYPPPKAAPDQGADGRPFSRAKTLSDP